MVKPQRVRDPLHNLVEFGVDQFESVLWQVVQTRPFQRLRRIKQLGFSELVYPGATHTRFSHCLGVFNTARHLMRIIERHIDASGRQFKEHQAQVALAAALVHDLGHGMFSHAFETVGKELGLKMAQHEIVSDALIREGEVSAVLKKELGSGFANDVADVIKQGRPGNLYDAVVSSQFDADRLDYMQRDRLMTGVQNSGIDFTWLMANLEIAEIPAGVDEQATGKIETFVLGPKASYAAETYVLALFQLYPTIYLHKTTRAAEKLFTVLMVRVVTLVRDGKFDKTGLPVSHPIVHFAENPDSLDSALCLDDSVFWGALSLFADAADNVIRDCATRIRDRRLPKCFDLRNRFVAKLGDTKSATLEQRRELKVRLERLVGSVDERLRGWAAKNSKDVPRILTDRTSRDPYKRFQESKGPLNQIHIRMPDGRILDVAEFSSVIASIESFELFRAYASDDDTEAKAFVEETIADALKGDEDGQT